MSGAGLGVSPLNRVEMSDVVPLPEVRPAKPIPRALDIIRKLGILLAVIVLSPIIVPVVVLTGLGYGVYRLVLVIQNLVKNSLNPMREIEHIDLSERASFIQGTSKFFFKTTEENLSGSLYRDMCRSMIKVNDHSTEVEDLSYIKINGRSVFTENNWNQEVIAREFSEEEKKVDEEIGKKADELLSKQDKAITIYLKEAKKELDRFGYDQRVRRELFTHLTQKGMLGYPVTRAMSDLKLGCKLVEIGGYTLNITEDQVEVGVDTYLDIYDGTSFKSLLTRVVVYLHKDPMRDYASYSEKLMTNKEREALAKKSRFNDIKNCHDSVRLSYDAINIT